MAAAWAGLRADLLDRVLQRLPCLAHRAVFAAVCFNWRSLSVTRERERTGPPQPPWLLLPSTAAEDPSFFCILCRDLHRAALPDDVRAARCCGSLPGDWLVLALLQFRGYTLYNFRTGQRAALPDILATPGEAAEALLITHAAARLLTPGVEFCLAAAVTMSASNIAFWSPGMGHWSPPTPAVPQGPGSLFEMVPSGTIADVMYYIGHGLAGFHALTDTEELLVYDPVHAADGGALETRPVTYRFPNHRVTPLPQAGKGTIARYLVNHSGNLLMVVRTVSPEGRTLGFRVFRLTEVMRADVYGNCLASWSEIPAPGCLFFLGRCSSVVYDLYGHGLDGFYFLDDATSFHDAARSLEANRQYPCSDMGWLPSHSDQVQRIFPERPPSEYSRAAWFFHY